MRVKEIEINKSNIVSLSVSVLILCTWLVPIIAVLPLYFVIGTYLLLFFSVKDKKEPLLYMRGFFPGILGRVRNLRGKIPFLGDILHILRGLGGKRDN